MTSKVLNSSVRSKWSHSTRTPSHTQNKRNIFNLTSHKIRTNVTFTQKPCLSTSTVVNVDMPKYKNKVHIPRESLSQQHSKYFMTSAGKLNSCDIYLITPNFSRHDTMVVLAVSKMKSFQLFQVKFQPPGTVLTIETLSGCHEPINNKTQARVHLLCITTTSFSSITINLAYIPS